MNDSERFQLRFGPYQPPRVGMGEWVYCERKRRDVKVAGWRDTPIPWPYTTTPKGRSTIIFADLVRAVQTESEVAVAHWWGVSSATVTNWRQVLGVGHTTEGTRHLLRDWSREIFTPEVLLRASQRGNSPEGRRKSEQTAAVLHPRFTFSERDDALLGTMSDRSLGKLIGCPRLRVAHRRRTLQIGAFGLGKSQERNSRLITADAEALRNLRQSHNWSCEETAKRAGVSRVAYLILENGKQARATHKTADTLAIAFGCAVEDFGSLPVVSSPLRPLFQPEMSNLLGTMTDQKVADLTGCHKTSVTYWRHRLGIQSYQEKLWEGWHSVSGEKVRRRRKELGISLSKLVTLSGISKTHICRIQREGSMVRPETLEKLTSVLCCDVGDLLH